MANLQDGRQEKINCNGETIIISYMQGVVLECIKELLEKGGDITGQRLSDYMAHSNTGTVTTALNGLKKKGVININDKKVALV